MPDSDCIDGDMQIRVLNDEESKDAEPTESETDDVFLRKIEATLLTQVCSLDSDAG